ncbi:MAG: hypothetical protein U1G08_15920 [Verrucomicrobiota bacterium]
MIEHASFIKQLMAMHRREKPSAFTPAPPPAPRTGPPTPRDDAFHYKYYTDSPGIFWYAEWWYFNFTDPVSGISGMCAINVFNPGNIDLLGLPALTAAIFPPGQTLVQAITDYYELDSFTPSYENANTTLGSANRITVVNESTYRVEAASRDGSMRLDLTYTRRDDPIFLAHDVRGDEEPWEISSWLVDMPAAVVNGTVTYQGVVYTLKDVRGYHDHDWGLWHVYARTWSWAQFCNPQREISFDLGVHAAFQVSDCYFRYRDLRIRFTQDQFKVTEDGWEHWDVFWKYPTQLTFAGVDPTGQYRLEIAWTVRQTCPIWKAPILVYEQSADYTGTLFRKSPSGAWESIVTFQEPGFAEYTDTWL